MTLHPLNVLDALILITLGWNIVRGFNKGFVEEIISVAGIFVSAFLAFRFAHVLAGIFVSNLTPQVVIFTGVLIFGLSFVFFKYVAYKIDSLLSETVLGILNNFLGFLFGVVRGLVISSLLVAFIAFTAPQSYLIKKSYLGGACVPIVDYVVSKLPEETKKRILPRWEVARSFLLENWKAWKEDLKKVERKERAV